MRGLPVLVAGLALFAVSAAAQMDGMLHSWDTVVDMLDSKNDTSLLWVAVQTAGLDSLLDDGNLTATVFAPLDEYVMQDVPNIDAVLADEALLTKVLSYHVVPGVALKMSDLVDGDVLQTAVPGPEGQLKVYWPASQKKPALLTTSGQKVALYQYDLVAGAAIVHTVKGVLLPGSQVLVPGPEAEPPTMAGMGSTMDY